MLTYKVHVFVALWEYLFLVLTYKVCVFVALRDLLFLMLTYWGGGLLTTGSGYKDMAKVTTLKKVSTPFMDDSLKSFIDNDTKPGILSKVACSVLMQVLQGARTARFDLLKVVQGLAAKVSKWTLACDSELFQLMSYIDTLLT